MNQLSQRLVTCIDDSYTFLSKIEGKTSVPHREGKWSQQEIIGHLIDSAINNYRRFVIGNTSSSLIFDGYKQDQWVEVQKYNDFEWIELLNSWRSINILLSSLIEQISEETIRRQHSEHNFHQIGFAKFLEQESYSLGDFIIDYIDHIEYHINQIKLQDDTNDPK